MLLIAGVIGVITARRLATRPPEWWSPPVATDPATLETARAVENGVTTLLHQPHAASESWTLSLNEADANAWLAARLHDWVMNQDANTEWPEQLRDVSLDYRRGTITLGARVMLDEFPTILSATLVPSIDDDGAMWLKASSFAVGRLSVPASWMLRAGDSPLRRIVPSNLTDSRDAGPVLDVLAGEAPLTRRPILKLSDGRRVRVTAIQVDADRLLVTCKAATDSQ